MKKNYPQKHFFHLNTYIELCAWKFNTFEWKRRTRTVGFQRMFGILEHWNNNQIKPFLGKLHAHLLTKMFGYWTFFRLNRVSFILCDRICFDSQMSWFCFAMMQNISSQSSWMDNSTNSIYEDLCICKCKLYMYTMEYTCVSNTYEY